MNKILEVRGLCKKYDTFELKDVGFELPGGYIMGFIGPNGAGKTTTLKLILSVIQADSGGVRLFGEEASAEMNSRIGVVMDAPLYVDDWTLNDVEKAVSPFYDNWDGGYFSKALTRFGLERKKKVKELSRGMKVKLQIAAALSHDARLLVLDEPTSGLDPVARDEICELLREFVSDEEHSVLFSTHITSDLEKVADYITLILRGGIVFTGQKDDFLEKYARISGGLNELSANQRKRVVGYREHGTGFEGMIESADAAQFPRGLIIEPITLDEIIIFMNKGESFNEQN